MGGSARLRRILRRPGILVYRRTAMIRMIMEMIMAMIIRMIIIRMIRMKVEIMRNMNI